MYILGTLKTWKKVNLDEAGRNSIRLLLQSFGDQRRLEILAEIEHLRPAPAAEGEPEPDASDWMLALSIGFAKEAIKNWEGIGHSVEDGKLEPLACTPENIELLMKDMRVSVAVFSAINEVNSKFVEDVATAGNA